MESSFISAPTNFEHMEGNSVNFKKTFDLNGTDNDEMLRLYLRKAGLSDEIEYLTPEQRRAFIYDIIKSNKMPGYWMPSTMKTSLFTQTPPAVRPPPPPASMRPSTNSPLMERRPEPPSPQYASMSTSSSTSSLQSLPRESPILPHRFAQPTGSPSGPPSPSTFVTGQKGKYEISGPMNFRHISGDMTRDMTRNAFDLSRTMNDNVLKKYLIERGIREEDISGMRKEELIKKIVQSKYTWVPPRKNSTFKPEIKYATISSNSGNTLPPPPATPTSPATSSPTPSTHSADMLSNYSIITARFADPSQFPAPDLLYSEKEKPEPPTVVLPPLPPQALRPAPPPRKSKSRRPSNETPPPPSVVTATPNNASSIYSTIRTEGDYAASTPEEGENLYSTPITTTTKPMPNQKPSRNSCVESENNLYESIGSSNQTTTTKAAPTPPPPPMPQNMGSSASPPPPPPPTKQTGVAPTNVSANTTSTEDSRDALLESIRNGVTLKKVNKKASTVGAVKPKSARKPIAIYQPPKPINARTPPPPTPPMKQTKGGGGAPPPPPMQQTNGGGGAPPPPPPPIKQSDSNTVKPITASTDNSGDSRDAFLESIRKGVALKKVDQKAATVSGARTRADRKPPVTDFLSELKMGITLRKVKLSGDNDEDEPDETDA